MLVRMVLVLTISPTPSKKEESLVLRISDSEIWRRDFRISHQICMPIKNITKECIFITKECIFANSLATKIERGKGYTPPPPHTTKNDSPFD